MDTGILEVMYRIYEKVCTPFVIGGDGNLGADPVGEFPMIPLPHPFDPLEIDLWP